MEVDIASLEKGKECANFLVLGNMFYEGDESVPHSHVMGIVMHSITKVFLGSAKTRQAILMERPTSFWA